MLQSGELLQAVDDAASALMREQTPLSAHIAALAVRMKGLVRKSVNGHGIDRAGQLFDLCCAIDADRDCTPDSAIAERVAEERGRTLLKLLQLLYERKGEADPDAMLALRQEQRLLLALVRWLPSVRQKLGRGKIGPDWIRRNCDDALWKLIEEHVYDWDDGEDHWERLGALLPSDFRTRYDATLTPFDLPPKSEIDAAKAKELIILLAKRRGLSVREFIGPMHLARWYEEDPHSCTLLCRYALDLANNNATSKQQLREAMAHLFRTEASRRRGSQR
jgi:hypothetical protein